MSNIDMALNAVNFIETHLTDDIAVGDVADRVSLSLFHFSRVFSRTTRHSPYDYLMRRRLCEAARRLAETDEKVIDIALAYQFKAPETFSRAFRRMFGLQPRQVRAEQGIDPRRLMPPPSLDYLEFLNGRWSLTPVACRLPELCVMGVANQISVDKTVEGSIQLWAHLDRQMEISGLLTDSRQRYGILLYDASWSTEHCTYLAGTTLEDGENPPTTLLEKHLPSADYACFDLPACEDAARFTRAYVYHTWWPKMTTSPPGLIEVECLPGNMCRGTTSGVSSAPHAIYFALPTD